MKYYEISELRSRVYKMKEDIRNDFIEEWRQKHGSESDTQIPSINVNVRFQHRNEVIDIFDNYIAAVTIVDDDLEVYQMHQTRSMVSKESLTITVVFTINGYVKRLEDVLSIGDESHTFNTYEEFLTFMDERLRECNLFSDQPIFVVLRDRKTGISLANIFNPQWVSRKDVPNIPGYSINMLSVYKQLANDVKENIDKLLCPITISKKDVGDNLDLDYITVYVDKGDLIKSVFQTDKWNSAINEALTVPAKDINKARTK